MNILRFLREQAKDYDCHVCGGNHSKSEIRVLGKLESAWIVRVTCGTCQTAFKLLVVVDESDAGSGGSGKTGRAAAVPVKEDHPSERRRPPVTLDEVLDVHEFLSTYEGGVSALLPEKTAHRAR
ncbi:MAG: hypothetical protein HY071_03095 [Chloroflexi bacterium]|nr:hypothetical protein [Chloroflexota bacterium]